MDDSWWASLLDEDQPPSAEEHPREFGHYGSSHSRVGTMEDWNWARDLFETDNTIELPVIGCNRGGLLVEARSLRGFVPISHLIEVDPEKDEEARSQQMATLVGKDLRLKVIEYDPERGRLVLSERAALAGPGKRIEILDRLSPGERCRGVVTNITRFGVFVDLGGVEGLIHVSELSWGRVRHPADVVACGEELEVAVLSVDREQSRIALSLKKLLPDPWGTVGERFEVGQIVDGMVTNVVKFGAFVGLDEGVEGLIHVSEIGDGNFLHPRSVIREGEHVKVRIIHIDPEGRRLGLSLRHVPQKLDEDPTEVTESTQREPLSSY